MGALAIMSLNRSVEDKIKRIQDLKRRILFLEDDDPISLIEPDIGEELFSSGKYVNAIARNVLSEEDPDDVFQEQGGVQFSNDFFVKEKKVALLFEDGIDNLGGIFLNLGNIISNYPLPSTSRIVNAHFFDLNIEQITSFDPTTVTWNNQNDPFPPGGTGVAASFRWTWGRSGTGSSFRAKSIPSTVKWTATNFGILPLFPGDVWAGTSALLISLSHSTNFAEPLTTAEILISPEEDITGSTGGQSGSTGPPGGGINVSSTFLVDVGLGIQIKCTGVPSTG